MASGRPGSDRIGDALTHLDAAGVGAIAYLAVLATFVGFGTWNSLLSRHPATTIAPFSLLVAPIGILSAWLLLGEQPSGLVLIGSGMVVLGLLIPYR